MVFHLSGSVSFENEQWDVFGPAHTIVVDFTYVIDHNGEFRVCVGCIGDFGVCVGDVAERD